MLKGAMVSGISFDVSGAGSDEDMSTLNWCLCCWGCCMYLGHSKLEIIKNLRFNEEIDKALYTY